MPTIDALLVDTHALLWWQAGSDRLSPTARDLIGEADEVLVSPITCWEVSMLLAKGRIALDRPVVAWTNALLGRSGAARSVDLTPEAAIAAGQLEDFHGDPADRLIYATALVGRLPLVSKDRRLRTYAEGDGRVAVVW